MKRRLQPGLYLVLFLILYTCALSTAAAQEAGPAPRVREGLPQWEKAYGGDAFLNFSLPSRLFDLCPAWSLSFVDADQDGFVDLFVSNHLHFPSRLYRNQGDGTFEDVSKTSGIQEWLDDHDAAWGDMDNDGLPDLATTNGFYRPDHLFRNLGDMRFADISESAGFVMGTKGRGRNCAFMDFDQDGYPDIFTANLRGPCYLYWNTGEGQFVPDTHRARLDSAFRHGATGVGDLDGDGLMDIVLTGTARNQPTQLFHNFGSRSFGERARSAGITRKDSVGAVALGDYDNDGDLDLFLGADEKNQPPSLYRNLGDGTFEDVAEAAGLGKAAGRSVCAVFFDTDNDGDLDLYVVNSGRRFGLNGTNLFFENLGNGRFRDITQETGLDVASPGNGSSIAVADVDGDGRLDFALANGKNAIFPMGPLMLFLNRTKAGHFLRLELEGRTSNRDALGAQVFLRDKNKTQTRQVGLRNAYSQDEKTIHFGLGDTVMADRVLIRWPSGNIQVLRDLPADRTYRIQESDGHQWFGDTPELLALRGRPSGAARACANRFGVPVDAGVEERAEQLEAAWRPALERQAELARRLGDAPPAEEAIKAYYEKHIERYTIPHVVWVDQVAIGSFSRDAALLHDGAGIREEETLRQDGLPMEIKGHLEDGVDLFAIALGFHLQAWRMPYAEADPVHGYISAGYYTKSMLEDRFIEGIAEQIWEAEPGWVLGPFHAREGLDVQDPSSSSPLCRLFRVRGKKRPVLRIPYDVVAPMIRRTLEGGRIDEIQKDLERDGDAKWPLPDAKGETLSMTLSIEARARAISEKFMAGCAPTLKAAKDFYDQHIIDYTLDEAILGRCLIIRGEKEAEEVAWRREKGQHFSRILKEMQVPDLTFRNARSNEIYQYRTTMTRSRIEGIIGEDVFDTLWPLDAGTLAGPYKHFGMTYYLFITGKQGARPIPFHQVEKTVRSELEYTGCLLRLDKLESRGR